MRIEPSWILGRSICCPQAAETRDNVAIDRRMALAWKDIALRWPVAMLTDELYRRWQGRAINANTYLAMIRQPLPAAALHAFEDDRAIGIHLRGPAAARIGYAGGQASALFAVELPS